MIDHVMARELNSLVNDPKTGPALRKYAEERVRQLQQELANATTLPLDHLRLLQGQIREAHRLANLREEVHGRLREPSTLT